MLILKDPDIETLLRSLSRDDCLKLLKSLHQVLQQYSASNSGTSNAAKVHQPQREVIATEQGNTSIFMPCSTGAQTAIKIVTVSAGGVKGCINVFEPDGKLIGLINAEELTAFRTALASMIPFERFPQQTGRIVVFGAGKQAEWHIRLALLLREGITNVTVVNRKSARGMEGLFPSLRGKYPTVKFDVLLKTSPDYETQLQACLAVSDAIFCCTPATTPHFPRSYLGEKARFISLIGSYKPKMQEIDSETLLSGGKILVDSKDSCLIEAGELIKAGVTADQLVEVGDVSQFDSVTSGPGSHIFKCVGLAVMDLVTAGEVLAMARERKIGMDVGDL
ncbi:ornithine cyclodeaminase [Stachybotrys elegans]|uniref:Ornithine cyclodeaminase n=1 Tax=Stachybotrys elegans TaxID=80388 RepID=A0A8K0SV61_9HYPO|nr:ornithine cyclodeaminase [Stachybotrys elegans]